MADRKLIFFIDFLIILPIFLGIQKHFQWEPQKITRITGTRLPHTISNTLLLITLADLVDYNSSVQDEIFIFGEILFNFMFTGLVSFGNSLL